MLNLASKLDQIGPQIGQIWDFLRSVSIHFGSPSQNVLKLILKSPRFVSFGADLTQFGCQIWHLWGNIHKFDTPFASLSIRFLPSFHSLITLLPFPSNISLLQLLSFFLNLEHYKEGDLRVIYLLKEVFCRIRSGLFSVKRHPSENNNYQ